MARGNENILEALSRCPWWVSVVCSGVAYVGLRFIVPTIEIKSSFLKEIASTTPILALPVGIALILPAPFAYFNARRKQKLVDHQTGIESVRALSWKHFEELVGEAYRRKGYSVVENHEAGADGGIDLRLKKAGNLFLVQCKHWKTQKVNVRVVREMYGLMTAERAAGVIIITSGLFTHEAKLFAEKKPLDLVEGHQLVDLIRSTQRTLTRSAETPTLSETTCQKCGSTLVLRVARRGKKPGSQFWGCSKFPKCTFTQEYRV